MHQTCASQRERCEHREYRHQETRGLELHGSIPKVQFITGHHLCHDRSDGRIGETAIARKRERNERRDCIPSVSAQLVHSRLQCAVKRRSQPLELGCVPELIVGFHGSSSALSVMSFANSRACSLLKAIHMSGVPKSTNTIPRSLTGAMRTSSSPWSP